MPGVKDATPKNLIAARRQLEVFSCPAGWARWGICPVYRCGHESITSRRVGILGLLKPSRLGPVGKCQRKGCSPEQITSRRVDTLRFSRARQAHVRNFMRGTDARPSTRRRSICSLWRRKAPWLISFVAPESFLEWARRSRDSSTARRSQGAPAKHPLIGEGA